MSNNKQTAVEWLQECLNLHLTHEQKMQYEGLFQQAKEMEKEQHKNTWFDSTTQFDNAAEMTYKKTFEQYYNEEYGGNK